MDNTGLFGMPKDFIDTLNESELSELGTAKKILDKYAQKLEKFDMGTDESVRDYIMQQEAKEKARKARTKELASHFI